MEEKSTSLRNTLHQPLVCLPRLSEGTPTTRRYDVSDFQNEGNVSTTAKTLKDFVQKLLLEFKRKPNSILFTQESVQSTKNNLVIFKGKLLTSSQSTLIIKLLKMLGLGSTSKGVDYLHFWNKFTQEMSTKLLSCTKTDYVDMASNCWSSSLKKLAQNCWFIVKMFRHKDHPQKNWQQIYLPSLRSLLQDTMVYAQLKTELEEKKVDLKQENKENQPKKRKRHSENKNLKDGDILRTTKIRVWLKQKSFKRTIENNLNDIRWTYNQCVQLEHGGFPGRDLEAKESLRHYLRRKALNAECLKKTQETKIRTRTMYDLRDGGLDDFLIAYSEVQQKRYKGEQHILKFRSCLEHSDTMVMRKKYWKQYLHWFESEIALSGKGNRPRKRRRKSLPDELTCDSKLLKYHGRFYFLLVEPANVVKKDYEEDVVALDPGVKTFMTAYSLNGTIYEWGKDTDIKIIPLRSSLSRIRAKMKTAKHKSRWHMKKAADKIQLKIKNLIRDLHTKCSKWLCETFNVILLPSFDTSQMAKKQNENSNKKRKISAKTTSSMLTLSHYKFKQRLVDKVNQYPNCKLYIVDEHYTSKTCGCCGNINNTLIGEREWVCQRCDSHLDRDHNASRNILLRFFSKTGFLKSLLPQKMVESLNKKYFGITGAKRQKII